MTVKKLLLLALCIILSTSCKNISNTKILQDYKITTFCERAYTASKEGNINELLEILYEVGEFSDTLTDEEFKIAINEICEWNEKNYFKSGITSAFCQKNSQHIVSDIYEQARGYLINGVVYKDYTHSDSVGKDVKILNLNYYLIVDNKKSTKEEESEDIQITDADREWAAQFYTK